MRSAALAALTLLLVGAGCSSARNPAPESSRADDLPQLTAVVNRNAPAEDLLGSFICSGTLIAANHVSTAAHCVGGRHPEQIDVVVSAFNLCRGSNVGGDRRHVRTVALITGTDAAVLTFDGPNVAAAPMPLSTVRLHDHESVTAYGWGRPGYNGPLPCTPHARHLNVVTGPYCTQLIHHQGRWNDDSQICAAPEPNEANTCAGDSGGPLVAGDVVEAELAGITSWGPGCASNQLGVYVQATTPHLARYFGK